MRFILTGTLSIIFLFFLTGSVYAMHISEGILPLDWAVLWFLVMIPFIARGIYILQANSKKSVHFKAMTSLVGAAIFTISSMPIPIPIVGSTSHLCGSGIAAILVGPFVTVVLSSIILLLQALFLTHGGLSALGADVFSMGVVGGFTGIAVFYSANFFNVNKSLSVFLACTFSSWAIYLTTAGQLALVMQNDGSLRTMFLSIVAAFIPTQIPLGIMEGLISAGAYRFILDRRPDLFQKLTLGRLG